MGSKETAEKQRAVPQTAKTWKSQDRMECNEAQWHLCGILSQDEGVFCSPHHTSVKEHIVLQTAQVLKLSFLRMQPCVCLCSALISKKRQIQVKIYPQLNHSWQQFPTWISGGPSWLRMILNHLHYGRALVVLSPLADHLFPQHLETFYPWGIQELWLNISPCIPWTKLKGSLEE